ncbi:DNA anti-recombination protein RmuC [Chitinophaga sp. W3I9]|uniref:hypothetical protein n=1 Tax=Chitinophaga sp. W3I9 TaxID=3373924 RepID=UPI003D22F9BF
MKAKGLMAIALLFSGAAFAQQTSVKTDVKVSANSQTNANAATGNAGVGASNTATIHAQSNGAEQAVQTVNSQLNTATATAASTSASVQNTVNSTLQTAGTKLENTATSSVKAVSHLNAAVNQTMKIQAAPIRINTHIAGGVLSGIL